MDGQSLKQNTFQQVSPIELIAWFTCVAYTEQKYKYTEQKQMVHLIGIKQKWLVLLNIINE